MNLKIITSILFFNLVLLFVANGQWVQTGGPQGIGDNASIEKVGNNIWAGCKTGIYISYNEGASWQKSSIINNDFCLRIKSFNDTVIVLYLTYDSATELHNLCTILSTDFGITWTSPTIIETTYNTDLQSSTIWRSGSTLVVKGEWDFYYSNDLGLTWTLLTNISGSSMSFYQAENNTLILSLPFGGSMNKGFYYSNNGIQNWTVIDTTQHNLQYALLKDAVFYIIVNNISVSQFNILKSIDFGATWDTVYTVPSGDYFYALYIFEGNIYAVTSTGYKVSYDNCITWGPSVFPFNFALSRTIALSNGDYLSHDYNYIKRYVTSQNTFIPTETGLHAELTSCLEAHNGVLYTSTQKRAFKSNDAGMTWSPLNNPSESVACFLFRGDTIICLYYSNPYLISRSFDNGLTWDSIQTPFLSRTSIEEINGRLFVGGPNPKYSDDWGLTWNSLIIQVQNVPGTCPTVGGILNEVFFFHEDTTLFGVTGDGLVAKLNNQSQTWDYVYCFWSTGANNTNKLYQLDNFLVIGGRTSLYYSSDQINWNTASMNGLPQISAFQISVPSDIVSINGTWFGTLDNLGVFYSNDQGNNWQPIQVGDAPFYAQGGLTVLNNVLYAGSYYSSIWKRSGALEFINGNVYFDSNSNGVKDVSETNLNQIIVKTTPSPINSTTNVFGNYSLLTDAIGDTLSIVMPSAFCSSNPNYYITNGAASNQNFGIQVEPNIHDLSVDMTNINVFRPGFQTEIIVTVKNNGSVAQTGQVALILDSVEQFLSATPIPNLVSGDTLIWTTNTLDFLETQFISVITKTDVTATLSDTVHCFATVSPILNDTFPDDNTTEMHEIIVGSYDPNDKTCSFGNYFTPDQLANNEELQYVIRFQNTGNFQADFVHIKDTLSNYFDLSTFRIISSSHLLYFTLSGAGIVDFYFDNIFLPPSSLDELNSHGYVKYGVRCKESVVLGNAMVNTAYIYFDFNTAIITNTTTTLVAYPVIFVTQIPANFIQYNTILVYPNPAINELNIDLRGINKVDMQLLVFDVTGNAVKNEKMSNTALNNINISNLSSGIYFGNVLSNHQKIGSFKFVVSK